MKKMSPKSSRKRHNQLSIFFSYLICLFCIVNTKIYGVDGSTVAADVDHNNNVPTANEDPPTASAISSDIPDVDDEEYDDDDDDDYDTPTTDNDDEDTEDEYGDEYNPNNSILEDDERFTKIQSELSVLHSYIRQRQWSRALERIQTVPTEATILHEIRDDHGKVQNRELPLHTIFSIDIVPGNDSDSLEPKQPPKMTRDQIEVIVELMKVHPIGITLPTFKSQLPLHLALYSSVPPPTRIIELFIKAYPKSLRKKDGVDSGKKLPLHAAVSTPLTSYDNVKTVLEAYPQAADVEDADESLPIHLASWGGNYVDAKSIIELLLSSNPDALLAPDGDGDVPLVLMAKYGRTSADAIKYLISLDPTYAMEYRSEEDSSTLLHLASSPIHGSTDANPVFFAIMETFSSPSSSDDDSDTLTNNLVGKINSVGQLPIHSALSKSGANIEIVESLLEAYPASTTQRDGFGYLPLHYVCRYGVTKIMDMLLDICGRECVHVPVTKNKHEGFLPFHLAMVAYTSPLLQDVQPALERVLLRLLHLYPEASKFIDPETKELPLLTAIRIKLPVQIMKVLTQAYPAAIGQTQAYTNENEIGAKELTTPIHLLVSMGHEFLTEKEVYDMIQYFQELQPDCLSNTAAVGRTLLHDVWKTSIIENDENLERRMRLIDYLLKGYPDAAKIQDNDGKLPLHYACWAHDEYGVEELLNVHRMGAMVKSKSGSLPLHEACTANDRYPYEHTAENNHFIMKQLLHIYSDGAFVKDGEGFLPLHRLCHAAGTDHFARKTVRLLLDTNLDAVETREDKLNRLPIHIVTERVKDCTNSAEGEFLVDVVRELVDAYPQTVSELNNANKTPLNILFFNMETLSSLRRDEYDVMALVAQLLYEASPKSALHVPTAKGNSILHGAAMLVGDLGGLVPKSWATLIAQICQDHPELVERINHEGRTPLHTLALYLSDTAIGARTGTQDPKSQESTENLELVVDAMIQGHPGAVLGGDQYGFTPIDFVNHERIVNMFGEKHHANCPIIQMLKRKLQDALLDIDEEDYTMYTTFPDEDEDDEVHVERDEL